MDKPKILLVLGDSGLAATMATYLGTRNFEPIIAKASTGALEMVEQVKPAAVVASHLMPGMDGPTLSKKIQESHPGVAVVMIAAVSSAAGITDVRRASSADVVLPSNFQPDALVVTLRRLAVSKRGKPTVAKAGGPEMFSPAAAVPASKTDPAGKAADPKAAVAPTAVAPAAAGAPEATSSTMQVEEAMRASVPVDAPAQPVQAAAFTPATSTVPATPIEPAYLISRAFADNVTGALRFVANGEERTIYFARGRPIVATSNVQSERIGQILIRKGKLTEKELEKALANSKKRNMRLVQVLVEMGVLTHAEHEAELAAQYTDRILSLFAWREASIEFHPTPPPAELVKVQMAPEKLVIEGLRRHYDVARLEAALWDPNRVPHAAPDIEARLPLLELDPLESAALIMVDGERSLADVCNLAPSRLECLRALYGCLCLGLLV